MLNQVILVGRLRSFEDFGIIIEVPRPETNAGADLIPCTLMGNIASNTKEYCNIGDLVGIKGRLESQGVSLLVKVDKVSFLSSSRNEDMEGGE